MSHVVPILKVFDWHSRLNLDGNTQFYKYSINHTIKLN